MKTKLKCVIYQKIGDEDIKLGNHFARITLIFDSVSEGYDYELDVDNDDYRIFFRSRLKGALERALPNEYIGGYFYLIPRDLSSKESALTLSDLRAFGKGAVALI